MAYRIRKNERIQKALHRIAREQIDKSVDSITDKRYSDGHKVHEIRKHCKRLRGLLHLFRCSLPNEVFERETASIRASARRLSDLRDADVMLETCRSIIQRQETDKRSDDFSWIADAFDERRRSVEAHQDSVCEIFGEYRTAIIEIRKRIPCWQLRSDGFSAVRGGLEETCSQCVSWMKKAYDEYADDVFHEWRKYVKYHRYHCRILGSVWSPIMNARLKQTEMLSEYLGDDHDLAVMREIIHQEKADRFSRKDNTVHFIGLLNTAGEELRYKSYFLGARLFSEKAFHFGQRIGGYWDCWKAQKKDYSPIGTGA